MNKRLTDAIAKVVVGKTHGTGFLVHKQPARVITALHVVAEVADLPTVPGSLMTISPGDDHLRSEPIKLFFGDPRTGTPIERIATFVAGAYGAPQDWAVLEFDTPLPSHIEPLRVEPGLRVAWLSTYWMSFGFPLWSKEEGLVCSGWIEEATRGQLFCHQAAAGIPMGGLSGGPCIVHGRVTGIMRQALFDPQTGALKLSAAGTLFMSPIADAMRAQPACFEQPESQNSRLVDEIVVCLEALRGKKLAIERLTAALNVQSSGDEEEAFVEIARAMVREGVVGTRAALEKLPAHLGKELFAPVLERVATSWLDDGLVSQVRTAVIPPPQQPPRPVVLNSARQVTAIFLLFRCGCEDGEPDAWVRHFYPVLGLTGEPSEIVDAIEKELRQALKGDDELPLVKLNEFVEAARATVVLKDGTPRDEVIEAIHEHFPALRVLYLTGERVPEEARAGVMRAEFALPELNRADEEKAIDLYTRACKVLALEDHWRER